MLKSAEACRPRSTNEKMGKTLNLPRSSMNMVTRSRCGGRRKTGRCKFAGCEMKRKKICPSLSRLGRRSCALPPCLDAPDPLWGVLLEQRLPLRNGAFELGDHLFEGRALDALRGDHEAVEGGLCGARQGKPDQYPGWPGAPEKGHVRREGTSTHDLAESLQVCLSQLKTGKRLDISRVDAVGSGDRSEQLQGLLWSRRERAKAAPREEKGRTRASR